MHLPRQLTPELMDDPSLDASRHLHALRGLARLNRVSRSARTIFAGVRSISDDRSLEILDIATGSGDVMIDLAGLAHRAGKDWRIRACDISPRAVEQARIDASNAGRLIEFSVRDALDGEPLPVADVIACSLFCHHLTQDQLIALLKAMAGAARLGIVINDLRRSRQGLALAHLASRCLTRSDVVRTDAVKSARAAWTSEEIRGALRDAGLEGASITHRWPSRLLATWAKPTADLTRD